MPIEADAVPYTELCVGAAHFCCFLPPLTLQCLRIHVLQHKEECIMIRSVWVALVLGSITLVGYAGGEDKKKEGDKKKIEPAPAYLEVKLPANAELLVDGYRTRSRGPVRTLVTPPLARGDAYAYELTARWQDEGKSAERKRTATVRAGETTKVDFGAGEKPIAKPKKGDWITLFNGKDTKGWK